MRLKMAEGRRGHVFFFDRLAGTIEQIEDEFIFRYHEEYLALKNASPISLTLPLTKEPYRSKTMIPFFDGLIPEGWLLDVSARTWKIRATDRMSLLLTVCRDCIGAVSVQPADADEEQGEGPESDR